MVRPKRPRDANQLAKHIVDVATGEVDDEAPRDKDPSAVERGRMGGKISAERLSPEQLRIAARKAAQARWSFQ